jgi:hypothetical protein
MIRFSDEANCVHLGLSATQTPSYMIIDKQVVTIVTFPPVTT